MKKRNPQDITLSASDVDRFWSYVDKNAVNGCWLWTGAKGKGYDTYGRFNVRGTIYRVTRIAYSLVVGSFDSDLELRHTCDVPACVNPAHLVPSTHAENMADMKAKGRGGSRQRGTTHCPRGHEYASDNLYVWSGRRYCRECKRAHWRANYGAEARRRQAEA